MCEKRNTDDVIIYDSLVSLLCQTFTSVSVQDKSILAWEQSLHVSDGMAGNL